MKDFDSLLSLWTKISKPFLSVNSMYSHCSIEHISANHGCACNMNSLIVLENKGNFFRFTYLSSLPNFRIWNVAMMLLLNNKRLTVIILCRSLILDFSVFVLVWWGFNFSYSSLTLLSSSSTAFFSASNSSIFSWGKKENEVHKYLYRLHWGAVLLVKTLSCYSKTQ